MVGCSPGAFQVLPIRNRIGVRVDYLHSLLCFDLKCFLDLVAGHVVSQTVIPLPYCGLVSKLNSDMPKYYHGTYPGAAKGILRNGFKASHDHALHEFHDRGGPGVYTYKENGLSTPQNGLV